MYYTLQSPDTNIIFVVPGKNKIIMNNNSKKIIIKNNNKKQ